MRSDAFKRGVSYYRARSMRRARFGGGGPVDPVNPYPEGTREHDEFWAGYDAAQEGYAE